MHHVLKFRFSRTDDTPTGGRCGKITGRVPKLSLGVPQNNKREAFTSACAGPLPDQANCFAPWRAVVDEPVVDLSQ